MNDQGTTPLPVTHGNMDLVDFGNAIQAIEIGCGKGVFNYFFVEEEYLIFGLYFRFKEIFDEVMKKV